jgi:hypothetical protein
VSDANSETASAFTLQNSVVVVGDVVKASVAEASVVAASIVAVSVVLN